MTLSKSFCVSVAYYPLFLYTFAIFGNNFQNAAMQSCKTEIHAIILLPYENHVL